jgi:membrane-bound ClpP family serine protease
MNLWPLGLRLMIGGIILIVVGLFVYVLKGFVIALALPVAGIVLLVVGFIRRPKKKN